MAVDPNTGTPQGPAGWGLNPLGTPSVSTMPLAPRVAPQFTPDQIAQMRKEAMALQTPQQEPIRHWTQGLAELVRAIQGNREADFARQQEATGRTQGAQAISDIYKPYLSPGGQPPPSATGAAPVGARGDAAPAGGTVTAGNTNDPRGLVPYIRETAAKYGVDPDTAVKVAGSEGLREFSGDGGKSGGAFQLYTGGGMGNDFQKETGLDPLDPKNEKATIDYALKNVPKVGWTPFHGARKVGIGQWDGITQANAGGAQAPMATGLLAPPPTATAPTAAPPAATPPNAAAVPPVVPANQASAAPATPTRLAYAGDTIPPGMLPTQGGAGQSPMSPLVNAIAGRPIPTGNTPPAPPPAAPSPVDVPDFAKQAAILAAQSDRGPAVPLSPDQARALTPQPPSPPNPNFAAQVAALSGAADRGPSVPLAPGQANLPGFPPLPPGATASPPPPAAVPPPSPVPVPTPRPTVPLPNGSAIPGAAGPTSVGGAPLVPPAPPRLPPPVGPTSVNGQQLPQGAGMVPQNAALLGAIAGQPAAGGGAPNAPAPIRVAQNGLPTAAIPTAATAPAAAAPGGPSGLPQPLTAPTGQVTQDQLTRVLANPWVPEQAKAAMLQMIQQRGQPQTMAVEGGTLMYDAAGHKVFIPEPKFGSVKLGSGAEVPTVSHFDPASGRWNTTMMAPGGGAQPAPGSGPPTGHPALPQQSSGTTEPDLSTIGGIQAEEARQAGAKKAAEAGGEASAKYYDSLHKGLAGSAMIAAQQKQNLDVLRQVAAAPDFTPGPGSDAALGIQRLASSLGINPTGAAPRELFNQVATRVLADQISGIKSMASETGETGGRIFKTMLDLEEKANITPQDSGPGINAKLNLIDNAGNLMMKWADLADDYVKEHGKLDAGFDKQLRSEIAKARLPDAVPQAEKPAPVSKVINGKTYYQIGGKVYDNPEGK